MRKGVAPTTGRATERIQGHKGKALSKLQTTMQNKLLLANKDLLSQICKVMKIMITETGYLKTNHHPKPQKGNERSFSIFSTKYRAGPKEEAR